MVRAGAPVRRSDANRHQVFPGTGGRVGGADPVVWFLWVTLRSNSVSYNLPDRRPLLDGVSLRVGEGAKVALIGPNGTGKTSMARIISGDLSAADGAVTRIGGLDVMAQFIGSLRDDTSVRDVSVSVAPPTIGAAAAGLEQAVAASPWPAAV